MKPRAETPLPATAERADDMNHEFPDEQDRPGYYEGSLTSKGINPDPQAWANQVAKPKVR